MSKVFIATSRQIGEKCIEWAQDNTPDEFKLCDSIEEADIIISVLYEKLFAPDVLKNKKCFNFHPGILPEYRGSGAFSWVIMNEEKKCGITLHLIDKGIDSGDIIEIQEFPVESSDTAYSLFKRGEVIIYEMFKNWFGDILKGNFKAVKQSLEDASLFLRKDLQEAKDLSKFIRAFYFPYKESAYYYNQRGEKKYIHYDEVEDAFK